MYQEIYSVRPAPYGHHREHLGIVSPDEKFRESPMKSESSERQEEGISSPFGVSEQSSVRVRVRYLEVKDENVYEKYLESP